ncbi:hypothetical protein [Collimonas humicola]|uniref:hypothetical protein n=1 Tax=Collimonas humicola TaxID=2825886 RepID=UPI001B8D4C86|nr:hypothetical protein [Collimonas humicola]
MNEYEKNNRARLIQLLSKIPSQPCPPGWRKTGTFAVGGLTEIGFSQRSELLLVVSSGGRGVIDCTQGEKIARDDEVDGNWYSASSLICEGIGPLKDERVQLAGLAGGGLPLSNKSGESLESAAPNWPKFDLFFCSPYKSALIEGHQTGCLHIASDYFRAFGFSFSGNSFSFATSSDVTVFSKLME